MIVNCIKNFLKFIHLSFKQIGRKNIYIPEYKIIEIMKNDDDDYLIKIQMVNKKLVFNSRPEDILAKDKLVDQFSPRDIRTLTYLGYLGINSPKYKILAKKLSEKHELVFALKKKGGGSIVIKTADEVLDEKDILESLSTEDARLIGYTTATKLMKSEANEKEQALKDMKNEQLGSKVQNEQENKRKIN